jgi:hypothetical protein
MAEPTAIVNLIDLVKSKPLASDAGDDDLFGGRVKFDAMAMPMPAQVIAPAVPQRAQFAHGSAPHHTAPPVAPHVPYQLVAPIPALPPGYQQRSPSPLIEDWQPTVHVHKQVDHRALVQKAGLVAGLLVVALILLSVYLAKGDKVVPPGTSVVRAPAPKPVVVKAVAPAPQPAPAAAAAPSVTPIESTPAEPVGITVTPIEPANAFERPVEPTVTTVSVKPVIEEAPVVETEPAPVVVDVEPTKLLKKKRGRAAKRATTAKKQKQKRVAVVEKAEPPAKVERSDKKLGGKGALVISSASPREVWIDGRNTKEMTPQKIVLAPGKHKVTLFDKKSRSAKTFDIEIAPGKTLRVAK